MVTDIFPTIKLCFNGFCFESDQLRTFDWTTVCSEHPAAYCCRLRPSSQRFSKSVAGHSVYLSTNFSFSPVKTFFFFILSSVLFNKHSSNELNGRLTYQYWSQRCSTQVVKGQLLPKYRENDFSPTGFFSSYYFFDCDKRIILFFLPKSIPVYGIYCKFFINIVVH